MHYVKRIDLWGRYLLAMEASLSVRAIAAHLGIDKDTAFRWRHRILATARATPPSPLAGEVLVETAWFPYLDKAPTAAPTAGTPRPPSRPVRTRLWPGPDPDSEGRVWVVLAEDSQRRRLAEVAGRRRPTIGTYVSLLTGRISAGTRLVGGRGPYSSLAGAARRLSASYERPHQPPVRAEAQSLRLRRWLRPFRGVSSRYLDRYMLWFNALEMGWRRVIPEPWIVGVK